MSATVLPSGITVDLSQRLLTEFCAEEWAYDDGVPDRNPTRILPEDVSVTVAMNSFVNTADKIRSVHRGLARACDRHLAQIPADADLLEYDQHLEQLGALLDDACRTRGVLLAVATKVLHRKRPGFIPMLDSGSSTPTAMR